MAIMLGNLTLEQMQKRCGFSFPQEALDILSNHQPEVNGRDIEAGRWHCFDIPFMVMCGSQEMAQSLAMTLMPFADKFKTPLQVSWN